MLLFIGAYCGLGLTLLGALRPVMMLFPVCLILHLLQWKLLLFFVLMFLLLLLWIGLLRGLLIMTDFEACCLTLLVSLNLVELVRLCFMLYAKFKPFFSSRKGGRK